MLETNKIYNGNCLDIIDEMEDGSIDCVITDPPYGTTACFFDGKRSVEFDEFNLLWARKIYSKIKDSGYLICFGSIELLALISTVFKVRMSGVWLKDLAAFRRSSSKMPPIRHEIYVVFVKKEFKSSDAVFNTIKYYYGGKSGIKTRASRSHQRSMNNIKSDVDVNLFYDLSNMDEGKVYYSYIDEYRVHTSVLPGPLKCCMKYSERTQHPTQKPCKVIDVLVKQYTNNGQLIVDPFCGSGTICICCKANDRRFIGIELNEFYHKISEDRVNNFMRSEYETWIG